MIDQIAPITRFNHASYGYALLVILNPGNLRTSISAQLQRRRTLATNMNWPTDSSPLVSLIFIYLAAYLNQRAVTPPKFPTPPPLASKEPLPVERKTLLERTIYRNVAVTNFIEKVNPPMQTTSYTHTSPGRCMDCCRDRNHIPRSKQVVSILAAVWHCSRISIHA